MGCMFKSCITLRSCPIFYNNGYKCPDSKVCKYYEEANSNTTSIITERYEAYYDSSVQHKNLL